VFGFGLSMYTILAEIVFGTCTMLISFCIQLEDIEIIIQITIKLAISTG
jgi:hypothetical protein